MGSALALRQKYCESSALYYHLRAEGMSFPKENDHEDNSTHRTKQNTSFRQSQGSLRWAAISLFLGAVVLISTFVRFAWLKA
jgi:hypothetical protein